MKLLCGILTGLWILVSGIAIAGTTYYVSPAGDDTNDGITLPWATIQHGVESLSQGDTLIVQEGIYYEPQGIMIDNDSNPNISGTETEPTRIIAQGEVRIITAETSSTTSFAYYREGPYYAKYYDINNSVFINNVNYVIFEGFTIYPTAKYGRGVFMKNSSYCNLLNLKCLRKIYAFGITLQQSDNCKLIGNICSNLQSYGQFYAIYLDHSSNNELSHNICSNNAAFEWSGIGVGIMLNKSHNNTIHHNICNNNSQSGHGGGNHGKGIGIYTANGINNDIFQNRIQNNENYGIYSSGSNSFMNNIFFQNKFGSILSNDGDNTLIANNLFVNSPVIDAIGTISNNTFVSYSSSPNIVIKTNKNNLLITNNIFYAKYQSTESPVFIDSENDGFIIDYNSTSRNAGSISNYDNEGSNNLLYVEPDFRDLDMYNCQLFSTSLCINTGVDGSAMGIYGGEYAIIDTDNDGMPDEWEIRYSLNTTEQDDAVDSDNDGFTNYQEFIYLLNPTDNDSDNDGLPDNEITIYGTSPYYYDSDFDMLSDYNEVMIRHTYPTNSDSDSDGLSDYEEINGWTNGQGTFYTSPTDSDNDDDGLKDGSEKNNNTNPFIKDTDSDGLTDYDEVTARAYIGNIYYTSDPTITDTDNDGASDYEEDQAHTNPRDPIFNPTHSPTVTIIDWDYYTEFTLRGSASGSNSGAAIENVLFCIKAGSPSDEEYEPALINGGAGTDNVQFVITKELFEYAYNLYIKTYDSDGYYGIQYFSLNNTINNPYLDSDGDGLNNWEETHIYHTNSFAKDTDNDGQNDRLEVWAGSDPNNSESVFMHSISHEINGDIVISWNCLTGRVYSVLVSDELDGVYVPLMTEITNNTNGEISVIDSGLDENNNEYHDEEDIYPPYLEYELVSRRCYKIAIEMPE